VTNRKKEVPVKPPKCINCDQPAIAWFKGIGACAGHEAGLQRWVNEQLAKLKKERVA
jgi:hypothetical protein